MVSRNKREKFPRTDRTGEKWGWLTVVRFFERRGKSKYQYWECICDCGNYKEVRYDHLRRGNVKSCGCARYYNKRKPDGEAGFGLLYRGYKYASKHRGIPFHLTKDELRNIVSQNCYYCGKEPSQVKKSRHDSGSFIYNGIDRVDNNKGYSIDNCVPACKFCNQSKNDLNKEDFLQKIKEIYERNFL